MKDLSFGWTWPAFVAGVKTVTRRDWKPRHASLWHEGDDFLALDRQRRFKGVEIGIGRVIAPVVRESLSDMPDSDYQAEGMAWLHAHPSACIEAGRRQFRDFCWDCFDAWRREGSPCYTVRFEILSVSPIAKARLAALLADSRQLKADSSSQATECRHAVTQ
jgi:hypothetical protein